MKDILLHRHAKAQPAAPGQEDHARPLTGRGRRDATAMAAWLGAQGWTPDLVLCSTALRTRETVAACIEALTLRRLDFADDLYLAPASALHERLCAIPEPATRVHLVGHNPGLADLARGFAPEPAEHDAGLHDKFPTGAVAWFRSRATRWADLAVAPIALLAFRTPAQLPATPE